MRIAVIRQKFVNYGGAEQFVSGYTNQLASMGHAIHIFANQWTPSNHPNIKIHAVRAIKRNSFLRVLSFAWFALRSTSSKSFDIVQSHERTWSQDVYRAGDGCHREWLERRARYLPFVKRFFFRFSFFHQLILGLEKRIFENGECKKIIAISEMVKRDILKHYQLPEDRVRLVYNGVDLHRFNPSNRKSFRGELRQQLRISDEEVMILFVGSGFERKGLEYLIKSVQHVKQKNWRLVLVGKGKWKRYLDFASKENRGKITNLEPIDEIEKLYAAADFFVLPSIYEPFGNANLEALASGLPIITSRNCGVAEIITPQKEGIILEEPSDSEAMAKAIDYLMDSKTREPMRQSARLLAEKFTQERNASEMLQIYQELIDHQ
ncbi:glycosyltransferase family 4 protein [Nitrospinaceae bacterium]|nr:glycosyltransferase family 4 protein [Nitrospinaceae bacterium]